MMIGLFHGTCITIISITGKYLYIMVNSSHRPSRRRWIQRRPATSMQDIPNIMVFLGKEGQKLPSITTRINVVSILLETLVESFFSLPDLTNNKINGILFFTNLNIPWNTWNVMSRSFRKVLRRISIWFRTWRGQEYIWGLLCQILIFRRNLRWCRWQKPDLRSMLSPYICFSPSP